MSTDRSCKSEGCGTPSALILASGFCRSHDPSLEEERLESARRGGQVSRTRWKAPGLLESDLGLGPNANAAEIAEGLRRIAIAVGERRISEGEGRVMVAALKEILRARDLVLRETRITELESRIAALGRSR